MYDVHIQYIGLQFALVPYFKWCTNKLSDFSRMVEAIGVATLYRVFAWFFMFEMCFNLAVCPQSHSMKPLYVMCVFGPVHLHKTWNLLLEFENSTCFNGHDNASICLRIFSSINVNNIELSSSSPNLMLIIFLLLANQEKKKKQQIRENWNKNNDLMRMKRRKLCSIIQKKLYSINSTHSSRGS